MKKLTSLLLTGAMICSLASSIMATNTNKMVEIDLWNANLDQPSMGNIATDNNGFALYNPEENTLQIATNPVEVSGYQSGLSAIMYDTTGNGDFVDAKILSSENIETGTKYDGENHEVVYLSSFEIEVPEYLTYSGYEYINIKMRVPYTPMDVVIGEGYLESRIRINWNNISETELEEIVPNTEISSGAVLPLELNQEGIKIVTDTNSLSEVTKLNVEKITSGAEYDMAKSALEGETNFNLYSIKFTLANEEISPTGAITIEFPYENLDQLYRINGADSKTVLIGTQNDTNYEIMTRTVGLFAVVGGELYVEPTIEEKFTDVTGHWALEYIENAVNLGLFNGVGETSFGPNLQMTNAMAITVLHRIAGEPQVETTETIWYAQAVAWGLENSIIGGYNEFILNDNITREALATMIYKYELTLNENVESGNLDKYIDAGEISSWAVDGLAWANSNSIVNGKTADEIKPQDNATRAEVATMFCRYINK